MTDRRGLWMLAVLAMAMGACSSSSGGSTGLDCRCPNGDFLVTVPAGRAGDIQSATATGACSIASVDPSGISISEDSVGICHIAVVFKSGAPEFVADVPLTRGTYECEAVCAPTPSSPVAIPELVSGAGGDAGAGGAQD